MNEMLDSQLSAMFDDELPAEECELLARRLARDESLQARWRSYAVIGATLRGEQGVALRVNVAARVHGAIAAEPALSGERIAAPAARSMIGKRIWQGAAAAAVAASVAVISVFWLRTNTQTTDGNSVTVQTVQAAPDVRNVTQDELAGAPDRYVVPATSMDSRPLVPTAELANYVVAHSEFSSPLIRRNLLSSLVASELGTGAAPEQSEEAPPGGRESDIRNENARTHETHVQVAP